ncbi:hypothetical protein Ddc_00265 [Ditylenchus destructor]|nr:hypothetical protein Ddc_00265 [Ditylenchus destructor]
MSVEENALHNQNLPCFQLSNELWLRVFGYMDRNDVDTCQMVASRWDSLIRRNRRYLPGRTIEYLILSSKRQFSVTICSGDLIKVYKYRKYFSKSSMNLPLNDQSHMTVETIKRDSDNAALFKFSHVQQLYLNPIQEDIPDEQDQKSVDGPSSSKRPVCNTCPLSFPVRPNVKKTAYKISTPPTVFFRKLNFLLRNLHQIKYFAFARFTLTNAFVGKFLMNVDQMITVRHLEVYRTKQVMKPYCKTFLFAVLITEKVDDGNHRMIWEWWMDRS